MLNKSIVFLVLLIASASARSRRDVQPSQSQDSFQNLVNAAEATVKEAGEHISKMLGLDSAAPMGNEVIELIKKQTKSFTEQAEVIQKQLEEELKKHTNTTMKDAFENISSRLQSTITTFRQQIEASGVTEQAANLQQKFQEGMNALVEEGKKLATAIEPQVNEAGKTLQDLSRKVIDEVVDNINQLQQKMHSTTGHEGHH